ncbi:hypothetical protein E2E30_17590 [Sphingomonas sp. AAP5]|nr:hypothetical protein E2E30_17590 [Sphingomonas sp. AAP5]
MAPLLTTLAHVSLIPITETRGMPLSTHAAHLQHQINTQLELAGLALCDSIRAMHEDLEKLYRSQLVALVLAEQLALAQELQPTRPTPRCAAAAWSYGVPMLHDVTHPV